jgi:hypothetical protein
MQAYYPKSRIVQNQYTNGGEFILTETKEDYIGSYWITFEEEYYTGINQYDLNVRSLTLKKNPPKTLVSSPLNSEYKRIIANTTSPEIAALNATQVPELFFPKILLCSVELFLSYLLSVDIFLFFVVFCISLNLI